MVDDAVDAVVLPCLDASEALSERWGWASRTLPVLPVEVGSAGTPVLYVPVASLDALRRASLSGDRWGRLRSSSQALFAYAFFCERGSPLVRARACLHPVRPKTRLLLRQHREVVREARVAHDFVVSLGVALCACSSIRSTSSRNRFARRSSKGERPPRYRRFFTPTDPAPQATHRER